MGCNCLGLQQEGVLRANGSTQPLLNPPNQVGKVISSTAPDLASVGVVDDVADTRSAGPSGAVGWSGVAGSSGGAGAVGSIIAGRNDPPAAMPTPPSSSLPTPAAPPSGGRWTLTSSSVSRLPQPYSHGCSSSPLNCKGLEDQTFPWS